VITVPALLPTEANPFPQIVTPFSSLLANSEWSFPSAGGTSSTPVARGSRGHAVRSDCTTPSGWKTDVA
jgi:hypothetical protein